MALQLYTNDYCKVKNNQEHDISLTISNLADAQQNNFQGNNAFLTKFNEKNVENFQHYSNKRTCLAKRKVSPYFAPPWSSLTDSSLIWTAGCRPSFFMRLIYTLCGARVDPTLMKMLDGFRAGQVVASDMQLLSINALNKHTQGEEERLSAKMVFLQENIADRVLLGTAKERVKKALEEHTWSMIRLLEEADMCRVSTLKELVEILKPAQALDFLTASNKIHKYFET